MNLLAECIEGKIKHVFNNKEIITIENYCYSLNPMILMSSGACLGEKKCANIDLKTIDFKESERNTEVGSLGFKICEKHNGTPQIIDFWAANQWHSSSRCIFIDGSFIDNSSLAQKTNFLD